MLPGRLGFFFEKIRGFGSVILLLLAVLLSETWYCF